MALKGLKEGCFSSLSWNFFLTPFKSKSFIKCSWLFFFVVVAFGLKGRKQTKVVCAALTAITPSPQNSGCFPVSIFQCSVMVGAAGTGVNEYICLLREASWSCSGVLLTLQNAWVRVVLSCVVT